MSDRVFSDLEAIVRDFFGDPAIVLRPETVAADVPGWDSFAHLNIIVAVEEHFSIEFLSTEIENLQNVGRLADAIRAKLGG